MSKFIFENKEEYSLDQMGAEDIGIVASNIIHNLHMVKVLNAGEWCKVTRNERIDPKSVYRVLAKPYLVSEALTDMCILPGITLQGPECDIIRKLAASMEGGK